MKEKEKSSPGFFIQEQNSLGYDFWWFKNYLFVIILSVSLSEGNSREKYREKQSFQSPNPRYH